MNEKVRGALGSSWSVARTLESRLADGSCAIAGRHSHFARRWAVPLMLLLVVGAWPLAAKSQSWDKIKAHESKISALVISPDGKQLATAGDGTRIKVWELSTGALKQTLVAPGREIDSLAFNVRGQLLASAGDDKTVRIWDVAEGRQVQTLDGHSGDVRSLSYSPDGKWLASGSSDHTVKVWDAVSGALINTLRGHEGSVTSVAFSPDSKLLATASWDKLIKLWDVATWKERRKLAGHKDVTFVSREPGKMEIHIWPAGIYAIAFSSDGQFFGISEQRSNAGSLAGGKWEAALEGRSEGNGICERPLSKPTPPDCRCVQSRRELHCARD